jgi:hypothetical protein
MKVKMRARENRAFRMGFCSFICAVNTAGSTGRCNTIWYKAVFKGGVYNPRETVWAFGSAEERCVVPLGGGTVVA